MYRVIHFVIKQKTAYELRISDWSSDVCSSDLREIAVLDRVEHALLEIQHRLRVRIVVEQRDQEIAAKGERARMRNGNEAERLDRLLEDRKSDVQGKCVYERVDLGGRRIIKKKKQNTRQNKKHDND